MKTRSLPIVAVVIAILVFAGANAYLLQKYHVKKKENAAQASSAPVDAYNPSINPADFVEGISNKYLTFAPGTTFIYEGKVEEGVERIEVYVTPKTRNVMGVETMIVRDKEYLNSELIEETYDWFAQDRFGNVWYFGEDSMEIVDGKIASRAGSWEAGIDGARPGIVMMASPEVGHEYYQEYFSGEAMDKGKVIANGLQIRGPYGIFDDCIQTLDWNPLEKDSEEHKYYCAGAGNLVYEVSLEDNEFVQLMDIRKGTGKRQPLVEEALKEELQKDITEDQAREIALARVPGRVTDIEIEKKFGKRVWVVEIDADSGPETDAIIDIQTGEVLGTET